MAETMTFIDGSTSSQRWLADTLDMRPKQQKGALDKKDTVPRNSFGSNERWYI